MTKGQGSSAHHEKNDFLFFYLCEPHLGKGLGINRIRNSLAVGHTHVAKLSSCPHHCLSLILVPKHYYISNSPALT